MSSVNFYKYLGHCVRRWVTITFCRNYAKCTMGRFWRSRGADGGAPLVDGLPQHGGGVKEWPLFVLGESWEDK